MKDMISVVVPVYNVERYLGRCLDSVFSQNPEVPFEVIAVNDGSTDNSLSILEEYGRRYDNLVIIDQKINKSLAVARMTGIRRAKGYYIIHVDSDDWVNDGMISGLSKLAKEEGYPDVIVYNDVRDNGTGEFKNHVRFKEFLRIGEQRKDEVQHLFFGACWNKMVRKSLLDDLVYGTVYQNMAEDLIYATEVFIKSSRIVMTPSVYYNYFWNEESLTLSLTPEKYLESRIALFRVLASIKEKYDKVGLDWLMRIRIYKIDRDILGYLAVHHFSGSKIDREVFSGFGGEYTSLFGLSGDGLDMERLYDDRFYLMNRLAKSMGWVNAFKKIMRLKAAAFSGGGAPMGSA